MGQRTGNSGGQDVSNPSGIYVMTPRGEVLPFDDRSVQRLAAWDDKDALFHVVSSNVYRLARGIHIGDEVWCVESPHVITVSRDGVAHRVDIAWTGMSLERIAAKLCAGERVELPSCAEVNLDELNELDDSVAEQGECIRCGEDDDVGEGVCSYCLHMAR
jgi:hypothetical protein